MRTRIIITLILGLLTFAVQAQQNPAFSLYFFNPLYYNAAYAGSREAFSGTMVHRSQWVKMPGAPSSQSLSLHTRLPFSNIGLGLQAHNDAAGPMRSTSVGLTFAYHLQVNAKSQLSFGLTGTMTNIRIAFNDIQFEDQTDPSFVGNQQTNWLPDASAGLYFYQPRFYAGISSTNLLQAGFDLTDETGANLAKYFRHYYATSGVVVPISEKIDFRPSVLFKYVEAAPLVGEIDANVIFRQRLFIGAGYRTGKRIGMSGWDNMLIGMIEFEITNFLRAGYSYDVYLNRSGPYNSGTHEIMVGWDMSGRDKNKITSPRFF